VLSQKFWEIYSERQTDFLDGALCLLDMAQPVFGSSYVRLRVAEGLLEPVGVSLSLDSEGNIQEQWSCPSLLSSFARMLLQDLSRGMKVLRCECCRGPFVTDNWRARYCSKACGWRHRKRRARAPKIDQSSEE
jgi:hypothetical protein